MLPADNGKVDSHKMSPELASHLSPPERASKWAATYPLRRKAASPAEHATNGVNSLREAEDVHDVPPATQQTPSASKSIPNAPLIPATLVQGRWSLSTWLFWRNYGSRSSLASVGQLGGSQAGARLAYQLLPNVPERLALYGRVTSALRHPHGSEAAAGLSFQPAISIPLRFAVERRVALDRHARNAMAVIAVGGFGPVAIQGDTMLEGYGQAGVVGIRRLDAFIDGKVTMQHALPRLTPLSAGLSLSGGAQPKVARLDIGPQIEARVKLGNQPARISAEWRQRIAGNARPGSGPAITLAADF